MLDSMTIARVVDVKTKDGEEVGPYSNEQAYLYKYEESERDAANIQHGRTCRKSME